MSALECGPSFSEQVLEALLVTGLRVTVVVSDPVSRTATVRVFDNELTYQLLQGVSNALGTVLIDVVSTVEHGFYGICYNHLDLRVQDISL